MEIVQYLVIKRWRETPSFYNVMFSTAMYWYYEHKNNPKLGTYYVEVIQIYRLKKWKKIQNMKFRNKIQNRNFDSYVSNISYMK